MLLCKTEANAIQINQCTQTFNVMLIKIIKVGSLYTGISYHDKPFVTFFLTLELFWTYFRTYVMPPLSGLSWRPKIYRPEDLRGGAFRIRLTFCLIHWGIIKNNCSFLWNFMLQWIFSLLTQILCIHSDYFGIRVQEWLIPVASAEKMILFVNGWSQAKIKSQKTMVM